MAEKPTEGAFDVTLSSLPWKAGGSAHAVKLELEAAGRRPDGLLLFLSHLGRGAVDMTLRANQVELQASWRGIGLLDSATWRPSRGKDGHPSLALVFTINEDANNGPKTVADLVRFQLELREHGLQSIELVASPFDGPLFPNVDEELES